MLELGSHREGGVGRCRRSVRYRIPPVLQQLGWRLWEKRRRRRTPRLVLAPPALCPGPQRRPATMYCYFDRSIGTLHAAALIRKAKKASLPRFNPAAFHRKKTLTACRNWNTAGCLLGSSPYHQKETPGEARTHANSEESSTWLPHRHVSSVGNGFG